MRPAVYFLGTALLAFAVVAGCSVKDQGEPPPEPEPLALTVESLEITGEVDDPEVLEVDVDGEKWPVTDGEFHGTADTTGKEDIDIEAKDHAGNAARKTIEIE
jgi:hypothetical protein